MPRSTLLPSILALLIACSGARTATSSNPIRDMSGSSFTSRVAFAPSHQVSSLKARAAATTSNAGFPNDVSPHFRLSSLHMHHQLLSSPPSLLPSILTSVEEFNPEVGAAEAFQDVVSLSDLTSDPFLQKAFAATAVVILLLVAAKSIVTQMDEAVGKVAVDFDRVMRLKYPKKWRKFIDNDGRAESQENRIQKIVEEMEVLSKEEPEFMERVMRDVDRQI